MQARGSNGNFGIVATLRYRLCRRPLRAWEQRNPFPAVSGKALQYTANRQAPAKRERFAPV